jgi:DNA mismatch endonuclease (patch repair protein)
MDTVSKRKRSEIMSLIKDRGSNIEKLVRQELSKHGIKFCGNSVKYFGKPDIILKKFKAVIFVDSCFWHGCDKHCRIPNSRKDYWSEKIKCNIARDKEVSKYYRNNKWKLFRIWEHQLNRNQNITEKILKRLK